MEEDITILLEEGYEYPWEWETFTGELDDQRGSD
jgi:hypothetical protein